MSFLGTVDSGVDPNKLKLTGEVQFWRIFREVYF